MCRWELSRHKISCCYKSATYPLLEEEAGLLQKHNLKFYFIMSYFANYIAYISPRDNKINRVSVFLGRPVYKRLLVIQKFIVFSLSLITDCMFHDILHILGLISFFFVNIFKFSGIMNSLRLYLQ